MNGKYGLAITLTATVACLIVTESQAWAQGRCSVATLKGSYGVVEQGTVIADIGMPIPVPFPTANVAIVTYDGAGNLSATYTASYGGGILKGSVTGTYTVAPDCTYTDSVPTVHLERAGVITGEGMQQELRTIYTVPWIVGGGTRRRTPVGGCSPALMKGNYSLFGQGAIQHPQLGTLLGRQIGLLTFNGRGNLYGSETAILAGEPEFNTFTGTYTVERSCAVSAEISSSSGLYLHTAGVILGDGVSQEVRIIIAERGWIFVSAINRQ